MQIVIALFAGAAIITGFFSGKPETDSAVVLLTGAGNDIKIVREIEPASEKNFIRTVPQKNDFSCSAAALCTMLNYGYGENLTENEVISGLMTHSDKNEVIARRTFSIAAMKEYMAGLGYKTEGYRATGTEDLKDMQMPCITPVSIYGYYHFVVVKGIHQGHFFIADPYAGNLTFSEKEFSDLWYNNFVFGVMEDDAVKANRLVITEDDLKIIDAAMTRSYLFYFRDRDIRTKEQGVSGRQYYNF